MYNMHMTTLLCDFVTMN